MESLIKQVLSSFTTKIVLREKLLKNWDRNGKIVLQLAMFVFQKHYFKRGSNVSPLLFSLSWFYFHQHFKFPVIVLLTCWRLINDQPNIEKINFWRLTNFDTWNDKTFLLSLIGTGPSHNTVRRDISEDPSKIQGKNKLFFSLVDDSYKKYI